MALYDRMRADYDPEQTCGGYGPSPESFDEAIEQGSADLWPGGREEFDETNSPATANEYAHERC